MWIQLPESTKSLYIEEVMGDSDPLVPSSNGSIQVSESVGEALLEIEGIQRVRDVVEPETEDIE